MKNQLAALKEPFPAEAIDWRIGSTNRDKTKGIALAYLQARPVMDRLDEVLGPQNWIDSYEPIQGNAGPVGFICTLAIRIGNEWVTKTDGADNSDIEAIKGGLSDAFKRAAVKWGVGRYLYDLPTTWVEIEARGKSHVIKGNPPRLPAWALPEKVAKATPQVVIPEKGPEPKSDTPAREIEKGNGSRNNSTPTMTIEDACKVKNSDGTLYMNLNPTTLSNMSIGIGKALNQPLDDEKKQEYETKLQAIKILLQAKAQKEIA